MKEGMKERTKEDLSGIREEWSLYFKYQTMLHEHCNKSSIWAVLKIDSWLEYYRQAYKDTNKTFLSNTLQLFHKASAFEYNSRKVDGKPEAIFWSNLDVFVMLRHVL